jgi:hypothetical protein
VNTITLSKSAELADAFKIVSLELDEAIKDNSYIDYYINEARFNRFNDITITAEILLRDDAGIRVKRVSYVVIDGGLFKSLPHSALCDDIT